MRNISVEEREREAGPGRGEKGYARERAKVSGSKDTEDADVVHNL